MGVEVVGEGRIFLRSISRPPGLLSWPGMAAPAGQSPDEYAEWLHVRIGAEIRERREAIPMSAYALGKACKVSDQAILDIEQNRYTNGSRTKTLARICWVLGITYPELVLAAERRP